MVPSGLQSGPVVAISQLFHVPMTSVNFSALMQQTESKEFRFGRQALASADKSGRALGFLSTAGLLIGTLGRSERLLLPQSSPKAACLSSPSSRIPGPSSGSSFLPASEIA